MVRCYAKTFPVLFAGIQSEPVRPPHLFSKGDVMMLLFTTSGARFACEPEEILAVVEKDPSGKTGQSYCEILIGNKAVPIALTFDAMMVAIEEYQQERELELSKQEFPDEPGSTTETLGDAFDVEETGADNSDG